MHFTFVKTKNVFTIVAGFKEEHGDQRVGKRIQGDRTEIELLSTEVSFGLELEDVDNDHFALAACLIFLPFIGQKVSFSVPVSQAIADFLKSPNLVPAIGHTIDVVTGVVETSHASLEPTLAGSALALGGGFDAVSIKTIVPEVFTYHQLSTMVHNHVYHYPSYRFYSRREGMSYNGQPVCDKYVWSTVENIVKPRGVTTWATYTIPALLMAKQRGLNCILSGTVFEGSFCNNGIKYVDYKPNGQGDFIGKAFRDVGITIIPAATMMPEYVNAMQVFRAGLGDVVSHCIMQPQGGPCGKCMKCYRKKLIYEACKAEVGITVPQFEEMTIEGFDTDFIKRQTQKEPMYLSSSFKWLWERLPADLFLPCLQKAVERIPDVNFDLAKTFPPGFDVLPPGLQTTFSARSDRLYARMTSEEVDAVRAWDLTKSLS